MLSTQFLLDVLERAFTTDSDVRVREAAISEYANIIAADELQQTENNLQKLVDIIFSENIDGIGDDEDYFDHVCDAAVSGLIKIIKANPDLSCQENIDLLLKVIHSHDNSHMRRTAIHGIADIMLAKNHQSEELS